MEVSHVLDERGVAGEVGGGLVVDEVRGGVYVEDRPGLEHVAYAVGDPEGGDGGDGTQGVAGAWPDVACSYGIQ